MIPKKIIKRDGRVVDFDEERIINAIYKAAQAVGGQDRRQASQLANQVTALLAEKFVDRLPTVEDVQDLVEKVLIENGHARTAKAYILYRQQHAEWRDFRHLLVNVQEMVQGYLDGQDWRINENSNMNYSLQGLNNHIIAAVSSRYWLEKVYPPAIREAHERGDIHIHDLGLLAPYCCGWDLADLLESGFAGVGQKVESAPPRHFRTALGQIANFFYTLQGEAAGAQAFSSFDTYLAPFIRYDGLDYREVKQALQEFIFNLNVPTRVGFQTPFVNLTMDVVVPQVLAGEPVIIGGERRKECYGDFQQEMDWLNIAFCEVMMEGDARGRIFTFPIPTYNITPDFPWESPVADRIMAMTAKYGIPYFANFINSDLKPEDVRSMCLFPEEDILIRENGIIRKLTIGELFEQTKGQQLDHEWFEVDNFVEALSLNPKSGKLEWVEIKRLLKVTDRAVVHIRTKDGKTMRVSPDHLVAVYTKDGITTKKARDIIAGDFLLVMRDGSKVLNQETEFVSRELAWFMGLFVADGNYLYESRKHWKKRHRGVQINFNEKEQALIEKTKAVVRRLLNYDMKFIHDPRYENSLRGYIYNSEFARTLEEKYQVHKYGGLPEWIWSVSPEIILSFIEGFFDGDGYTDGKEIHINDQRLAEELNLLLQLVGISTTYVVKQNSQVIRIQHVLGRGARGDRVIRDKLHNNIPEFLVEQKYIRSEDGSMLYQCYGCKTVGFSTIDRWGITTETIEWLRNADFAVVEAASSTVEQLDYDQVFYDIELGKNHYFVHSQGNITHNCCRLRLDNRELKKRGGGLFGANPLTGSIGVVTINLPRLGYVSSSKEEFFTSLKAKMDLAKESLLLKRNILEKLTEQGLYPYSRFYLRQVKERFGRYWENHFNTIGIVGMHEALLNFMKKGIETRDGRGLALEILDFMRSVLATYQAETGQLFNLEATPAEGTSYRLARLDRRLYPDIITSGTNEPYYTNSTHLPVGYTDDVFTALEHQDELQLKYTGGTVFHAYLGERVTDTATCRRFLQTVMHNFRLPYFTITPTFSICPEHGYLSGEHWTCPACGRETEVWSRIVGYYRPVKNWNKGKQEEFRERRGFRPVACRHGQTGRSAN
ncbi:ribonucleoside triphosphate reductase [Neomoorella thermoacetica]|nr:ribonucleoside triphosphate reductase [Moorella thermoacetica]